MFTLHEEVSCRQLQENHNHSIFPQIWDILIHLIFEGFRYSKPFIP
eukprot:UN01424